jgi:Zn-dependent peptidase ImmA (M78 family)
MESLSPIEALMATKLREDYEGLSTLRNRSKILMKKLKNRLVVEVVNMIKGSGARSPPYDPFSIRQVGEANVKVIYTDRSEIGADGSIDVSDEGFFVRIDRNLLRNMTRLRSTMAHELMHTMFYDVQRLPPVKVGLHEPSRRDFLMEEELCYYLARQFLIPDFSLTESISKENKLKIPSLTNLQMLEDTYKASSDLVAFRLISDLALWNAIFIKSVKTNSLYRTRVMKNKQNKFYKRIQTPKLIPSSRTVWSDYLSRHIADVTKTGQFEEIVNFKGKRIALESRIEAEMPLTIVTLAYELPDNGCAVDVHSEH